MRIAILEPVPNHGGGSEQLSLELGRELAKRSHVLTLIHDRDGSMTDCYDEFVSGRYQVDLENFGWKSLIATVRRAQKLTRLLRSIDVDLVFTSNVFLLRFLALFNQISRIPVVLHLGIASPFAYASQRIAMNWIAAGITPSQHTADTWVHHGWKPNRIHVVNNWLNVAQFDGSIPHTTPEIVKDIPSTAPVGCYVGRLVDSKGVSVLLRAWKECLNEFPTAVLLVVGAGEDGGISPYDALTSTLGIADRVKFVGRTSTVAPFYQAADFSIVPSIGNESFGLTTIESMACQTPPIVSDIGILPEIVGPTAPSLVVPSNDVNALATKMRLLMRMKDVLPEMGSQLRQRVVEQYSPQKSVAQYERIMSQALVAIA